MGYNSTVVVMNDSLSAIETDKDFGRNLARGVAEVAFNRSHKQRTYISAQGHCNAAEVIETHHADSYGIVAVGANTGEVLGYTHYTGHPDNPDSQVLTLQQLADTLGYKLVKKKK